MRWSPVFWTTWGSCLTGAAANMWPDKQPHPAAALVELLVALGAVVAASVLSYKEDA